MACAVAGLQIPVWCEHGGRGLRGQVLPRLLPGAGIPPRLTMNSFGRCFRLSILGESHGPCVGILLDGCPAGLALDPADFSADMERRRGGGAPGTTPRREDDLPLLQTGVLQGRTTGAPILILFENKQVDSSAYEAIKHTPAARPRGLGGPEEVRRVRGHARQRPLLRPAHRGAGGGRGGGQEAAGARRGWRPGCWRPAAVPTSSGPWREAMAAQDSVGGLVECRVQGPARGAGRALLRFGGIADQPRACSPSRRSRASSSATASRPAACAAAR